jgi:hypothetical protein
MGVLFFRITLGALLVAVTACAASPMTPPERPADLRQTQAPERKRKPSRLVAPPPAYGNKIVGTPEAPPRDIARRNAPNAG